MRSTADGFRAQGQAPRSRNACIHFLAHMARALNERAQTALAARQPVRLGYPVQPWYVNVSSNRRPSPRWGIDRDGWLDWVGRVGDI